MTDIELEVLKLASELETIKLLGVIITIGAIMLSVIVVSLVRSMGSDNQVIVMLAGLLGEMHKTTERLVKAIDGLTNQSKSLETYIKKGEKK